MTDAAREQAFAHRSLTAAVTCGVFDRVPRPLRVTFASSSAAAAPPPADLIVTTVGPADDLAELVARVHHALDPRGVLAVVVASEAAAALVDTTCSLETVNAAARDRLLDAAGTYGHAIAWAASRGGHSSWPRARSGFVAPPISPARLDALVRSADAAGLVLVEPEVAALAPSLGRLRVGRDARARALVQIVASGALARPLLFVPAARAPARGLVKRKLDRIGDGWVAPGARGALLAGALSAGADDGDGDADLRRIVIAVLGEGGGNERPFGDLLRAIRARSSRSVSTRDTKRVAEILHHLAASDVVDLFMTDPSSPAWTWLSSS